MREYGVSADTGSTGQGEPSGTVRGRKDTKSANQGRADRTA